MSALQDLCPGGVLRAAINLGNPALARRSGGPEALTGVTVALAYELSRRIGCELALLPFESAGKVMAARPEDIWDIAFLAIDPDRAAEVAFTGPYVVIEGVYVVKRDSPWTRPDQLDRPGVKIVVGRGAAYDLHLSRTLRCAELVRAETSSDALRQFASLNLDAGAGVRQAAATFVAQYAEFRLLDEPFMQIRQAIALPRDRSAGLAYLDAFVEEMKVSGFVRNALDASGQDHLQVPIN